MQAKPEALLPVITATLTIIIILLYLKICTRTCNVFFCLFDKLCQMNQGIATFAMIESDDVPMELAEVPINVRTGSRHQHHGCFASAQDLVWKSVNKTRSDVRL